LAEEDRNYETAIKYTILKLATLEKIKLKTSDAIEQIKYFSKQIDEHSSLKEIVDFVTDPSNVSLNLSRLLEKEFVGFEENEKNTISNYFINCLELLMIEKLDNKRIPNIRK
jgi:hemerythrin-like domain-containing protein